MTLKINEFVMGGNIMNEEEQLIMRAKKGEKDAFEELFIKYKPIVYKLAKEYYIQGFDMDDWLQEASIVCYHSLESFDNSKGFSFGSFFKVNFKRHIISFIRHQNAQKRTLDRTAISLENMLYEHGESCLKIEKADVVDSFEYVYIREELEAFIFQLSNFEREVFHLYVKGYNKKEISHDLVCQLCRVNNAMDRVKRKLKQHLK